MSRSTLLIAALSLTIAGVCPAQANGLAQASAVKSSAKVKKVKIKHTAKPGSPQVGTQASDPASTTTAGTSTASGTASTVGRAIPVAAAHTNFFATPLGLITALGGAGGAAGAATLAAQGSASSPQ